MMYADLAKNARRLHTGIRWTFSPKRFLGVTAYFCMRKNKKKQQKRGGHDETTI